MRNVIATLSMAALAVAGTAAAGDKKQERDAKIARAMAVAEVDFELHRAQLGLIGSSLLSEHRPPIATNTSPIERLDFWVPATPAEAPVAPAAVSEPK